MKIRKWLYDYEASHLGLEIKQNENGRKNARYLISKDDWREICETFRYDGIKASCENVEVDPSAVKHLWMKTKSESIFVKNPLYVSPEEKTYLNLRDDLIKDLKKYSPKFKKIKRDRKSVV